MLSAIADLLVTAFQLLVDVTLWLGRLAFGPFRFVFSRQYRQQVRQNWSLHPVRAWFECIGGSFVIILFVAMISFWTFLFAVPAKDPTPAEQKEIRELKQRIIEKMRRHQKKPNTSNQSLQPTATRCASSFFITKTVPEIFGLAPGSRG